MVLGVVIAVLVVPWKGVAAVWLAVIAISLIFPVGILSLSSPQNKENHSVSVFLLWLGAVSYPIYVLHLPLIHLFERFLGKVISIHPTASGLVFLVIILMLADGTCRFFDNPVRKYLSSKLSRK